jgi:tRNA threonylcarbamoyladenosine biosynthesis protein TsaE
VQIKRGEHFHSISASPEATRSIGHALGKLLRRGDAVYIYGDVGAGKTVFVTGVASALGIAEYITSPTFTIANVYEGTATLCHFDAYRIKSPAELFETGFFDCVGGDCIVAVEWPERIGAPAPDGRVEVRIDAVEGRDTERTITIDYK